MAERWRRCSACKRDIPLGGVYWVCSVSTCNRSRTALVFCSVDCWEIHLPTERHRQAWAEERRAPAVADAADAPSGPRAVAGMGAGQGAPSRSAGPATGPGASRGSAGSVAAEAVSSPTDVLVVASKLKAYIREGSGFNTSDRVLLVLSDRLRRMCDEGIRNAKRAGRDTVLDRDVAPPA